MGSGTGRDPGEDKAMTELNPITQALLSTIQASHQPMMLQDQPMLPFVAELVDVGDHRPARVSTSRSRTLAASMRGSVPSPRPEHRAHASPPPSSTYPRHSGADAAPDR